MTPSADDSSRNCLVASRVVIFPSNKTLPDKRTLMCSEWISYFSRPAVLVVPKPHQRADDVCCAALCRCTTKRSASKFSSVLLPDICLSMQLVTHQCRTLLAVALGSETPWRQLHRRALRPTSWGAPAALAAVAVGRPGHRAGDVSAGRGWR